MERVNINISSIVMYRFYVSVAWYTKIITHGLSVDDVIDQCSIVRTTIMI